MNVIILGCIQIAGVLLLYGCVTVGEKLVTNGTPFPDSGTKGKAFLIQKPHELLKSGFRDGKLALVNIINISSKFGISEIQYGLVALTHPAGSPIPNPAVSKHVHIGNFKSNIGSMPVDHSGWPHYVRVQNFSDEPSNLLDIAIACESKPDPKRRFQDVSQMGVSFGNPYTCNLNPNEVYGNLWGSKIDNYGELMSNKDEADYLLPKLEQLRKIMAQFNSIVIDEVRRQTSQ